MVSHNVSEKTITGGTVSGQEAPTDIAFRHDVDRMLTTTVRRFLDSLRIERIGFQRVELPKAVWMSLSSGGCRVESVRHDEVMAWCRWTSWETRIDPVGLFPQLAVGSEDE